MVLESLTALVFRGSVGRDGLMGTVLQGVARLLSYNVYYGK